MPWAWRKSRRDSWSWEFFDSWFFFRTGRMSGAPVRPKIFCATQVSTCSEVRHQLLGGQHQDLLALGHTEYRPAVHDGLNQHGLPIQFLQGLFLGINARVCILSQRVKDSFQDLNESFYGISELVSCWKRSDLNIMVGKGLQQVLVSGVQAHELGPGIHDESLGHPVFQS